jgi:ribosomal subunit interface protein
VDVRVAGHQVETGDTLRTRAISRIEEITEKYFSRAIAANVTFGRGPQNDFTCDIVAPVANGVVLKSHHRAPEAPIAFEAAANKIERQLSRYMNRLREHKADGQPIIEDAGYTVFSPPVDDQEPGIAPAIIAETLVDIPETTVSDAVMLMDLRNTSALMFKNTASGTFNMIFRREDGNIGWVEPKR